MSDKDKCDVCGAPINWQEYDSDEDVYTGACTGPTPHLVEMSDDDETWK